MTTYKFNPSANIVTKDTLRVGDVLDFTACQPTEVAGMLRLLLTPGSTVMYMGYICRFDPKEAGNHKTLVPPSGNPYCGDSEPMTILSLSTQPPAPATNTIPPGVLFLKLSPLPAELLARINPPAPAPEPKAPEVPGTDLHGPVVKAWKYVGGGFQTWQCVQFRDGSYAMTNIWNGIWQTTNDKGLTSKDYKVVFDINTPPAPAVKPLLVKELPVGTVLQWKGGSVLYMRHDGPDGRDLIQLCGSQAGEHASSANDPCTDVEILGRLT